LPKTSFISRLQRHSEKLNETGSDAEAETHEVDPISVEMKIEQMPDEPSDERGGRQQDAELDIALDLHPLGLAGFFRLRRHASSRAFAVTHFEATLSRRSKVSGY